MKANNRGLGGFCGDLLTEFSAIKAVKVSSRSDGLAGKLFVIVEHDIEVEMAIIRWLHDNMLNSGLQLQFQLLPEACLGLVPSNCWTMTPPPPFAEDVR